MYIRVGWGRCRKDSFSICLIDGFWLSRWNVYCPQIHSLDLANAGAAEQLLGSSSTLSVSGDEETNPSCRYPHCCSEECSDFSLRVVRGPECSHPPAVWGRFAEHPHTSCLLIKKYSIYLLAEGSVWMNTFFNIYRTFLSSRNKTPITRLSMTQSREWPFTSLSIHNKWDWLILCRFFFYGLWSFPKYLLSFIKLILIF